jgi:uncharacterized membrane protein YphA (DoxX/SURF4 family)
MTLLFLLFLSLLSPRPLSAQHGAILIVQLKNGFSHYELEFLLCVSSLALLLKGGGRFSVDALLPPGRVSQ